MSTLFSRPLLIDRHDCDIISPNVGLEGTPSPMHQMKLQHDVIQIIYGKFGNMDNPMSAAEVREFRDVIEKWTESFPPMFRIIDPDVSMDEENTWIILHRRYLHTMAYAMTLGPLKSYLCRTFDQTEPQEEQDLRASGVDYCLKLHDAQILLFHSIYPISAKYHFTQVSLFDLAMVLCSAIIHDEHGNLPKRDEVIGVIADVLEMLRRICNVTGTVFTSYGILSKLIRRLPISQDEIRSIQRRPIAVKFDHSAQPAATPREIGLQPIKVQLAAIGQDQPGPPTSPSDSTHYYHSTAPVSIDTESDPFSPGLPLEYPGELLPEFQSELDRRLGKTILSIQDTTNSKAAVDMVTREQGASIHFF